MQRRTETIDLHRCQPPEALSKFPEEKERFDASSTSSQKEGPRVVWPCLRGESSRLLYLLDLYADKFSCLKGDRRLSQAPFNEAAMLVLEGEMSVLDPEGLSRDASTCRLLLSTSI